MRSEGGAMTAAMHRGFNAFSVALQNNIIEQYSDFDVAEIALGNSVMEFEVPWGEFCQMMGWRSNNKQNAKHVIDLLKKSQVEWGMKEVGPKSIGFQQLISGAKIEDGFLSLRVDPLVRRELLNHHGLSTINYDISLANIAWVDKYTPRIYEECLRNWRDKKLRQKYTIEEFRKAIDCPYVTDKSGNTTWVNSAFKDFKKRAINPAVKNINDTDFVEFIVNIEAVSRPVKFIVVNLKPRVKQKRLGVDEFEEKLLKRLNELGLNDVVGKYYNKLHEDDEYFDTGLTEKETYYVLYVLDIYDKYKSKIKTGGEAKYLITCLKSNTEAFEPKWAIINEEIKKEQERIIRNKEVKENHILNLIRKERSKLINEYKVKVAKEYLDSFELV